MSRSGRHYNFSSQRAALDRRVSDTDYDYDTHNPSRAPPSSRRAFFVFGMRGYQASSNARPLCQTHDPYPQRVKDEYAAAKKAASKANGRAGIKPSDPLFRERVERSIETNASARVAANTAAAYRSGFGHKYPYAYESPEKVAMHQQHAKEYKTAGATARMKEQEMRKKLH
ncbi:hypothetical protein CNMCM6457_005864 [Aspergillus fumigatiaffinis]|nr:hypothetical protein CNMCM6457_005864 [Aspergillus fumigatiaffinis]